MTQEEQIARNDTYIMEAKHRMDIQRIKHNNNSKLIDAHIQNLQLIMESHFQQIIIKAFS